MWKTYGCTIIADGWSGPTRMQVINFMVYCKDKTVFLKSVNASSDIREHKYLAKLLKDVINEVGRENVVQICTDNGSAFVKADIGKKTKVSHVITIARLVTVYIYNHGWVLALMRKICEGDLIRPGPTQFAINYISLQSLFQKKAGLKQLFTCNDWATSKYSQTKEGRRIEELVLENMFWDNVQAVISIYKPLYGVLRIVDTEVNPTMLMLYDLFKKVGTNLEEVRNTVWVRKIIDDRWFKQLCHPLHATAYYLNPMFQYSEGIGDDPELLDAVHSVFAKLDPNSIGIAQFGHELLLRDAKAAADRVAETSYLDLFNIAAEIGAEEAADPIYHWVRPLHLDDEQEIQIQI
ncbi:uncharacterized protein LOC133737295 [Rosa rugosa]|uniref:uncharacterized protein LOC133737295 n=1 Tax=Rosa rugosa TaxID=74645 RepID=UPI002B407A08|nr:uncharacterized protein LOC133737295 [Rosa rugosa]